MASHVELCLEVRIWLQQGIALALVSGFFLLRHSDGCRSPFAPAEQGFLHSCQLLLSGVVHVWECLFSDR